MKLQPTSWCQPNSPNPQRIIFGLALDFRHLNCIFFSHSYQMRCKIQLNGSLFSGQWPFNIFHFPLTCWPRLTLLIISIPRNLKCWHYPLIHNYSISIHNLHAPMRKNIILRCYSNYKSTISHPIYWNRPCTMNLRQILSSQSHPHTTFRLSSYFSSILF